MNRNKYRIIQGDQKMEILFYAGYILYQTVIAII